MRLLRLTWLPGEVTAGLREEFCTAVRPWGRKADLQPRNARATLPKPIPKPRKVYLFLGFRFRR